MVCLQQRIMTKHVQRMALRCSICESESGPAVMPQSETAEQLLRLGFCPCCKDMIGEGQKERVWLRWQAFVNRDGQKRVAAPVSLGAAPTGRPVHRAGIISF